MESDDQIARWRSGVKIDGPTNRRILQRKWMAVNYPREGHCVNFANIRRRGNSNRRYFMHDDRAAVMPLQFLAVPGTSLAISGIAFLSCLNSVAACVARIAVTLTADLLFHAAATVANRLEMSSAAATDDGATVKYGERNGSPHCYRSEIAAEKSIWPVA